MTRQQANILIVDDKPDNLRLLSKLLMEHGYYVRPVSDGKKAISAAKSQLPDLILLDIMMPGMNGYEVCKRLKEDEQTREIPVLFISALNEEFEKTKAFSAGGVDYITKPFQENEVLARIRTHLELKQSREVLQTYVKELKRTNKALKDEVLERKAAEGRLSQALKDKELLMKEIHHRVKNNLMVVQSLLSLQLGEIRDERSKSFFVDAQNRVKSMSMIHERLHRTEDHTMVSPSEYIQSLVGILFANYKVSPQAITLKYGIEDVTLDVDTMIPLGLIINELVSNALKYAFSGQAEGELAVYLRETSANMFELIVKDSGAGVPKGFDLNKAETLGIMIVTSLASQLGGEVEVSNKGGAEFKVLFSCKSVGTVQPSI